MLTAEKFAALPVEEQVTTLLVHGNELLERIFLNYIIKIYGLGDFHAEIWYQQITNRIDKVQIVQLSDVLHLYESQINISDLFR